MCIRDRFKKDAKLIEIRGMCDKQDKAKLKTQIFYVLDGGWRFFTATFNPTGRKVMNFSFNGEA